jgi:hypothetical protein
MFDPPPAYMCSSSFISSGIELLNMFERLYVFDQGSSFIPNPWGPVYKD